MKKFNKDVVHGFINQRYEEIMKATKEPNIDIKESNYLLGQLDILDEITAFIDDHTYEA